MHLLHCNNTKFKETNLHEQKLNVKAACYFLLLSSSWHITLDILAGTEKMLLLLKLKSIAHIILEQTMWSS